MKIKSYILLKLIKQITPIACSLFIISINIAYAAKTSTNLNSNLQKIQQSISIKEKEKSRIINLRKNVSKEINNIQKKAVFIASEVKTYEKKLNKIDDKILQLSTSEKKIYNQLSNERNKTIETIALMEKILSMPKGVILTEPKKPTDMIRTTIMLKYIIDYLDMHSVKLKNDLQNLKDIRMQINNQKTELSNAKIKITLEKNKISKLLNNKKTLEKSLNRKEEQAKKEISKLISESRNIEDLIQKAKAREKKYSSIISDADRYSKFASLSGKLPIPVNGKIINYFGRKNRLGILSRGIAIETKNNAQVIAPYDGAVIFANIFRSGKITIILYHGNNYYTVLTGVNKSFVKEGSNVLAGEPIAEMGGRNSVLQIELRYKNKTIDPLAFFKR